MSEVDVFEYPRFCDDFSHLMNRRFLASASLYLSLTFIQLIFHTFLRFLWISTLIAFLLMIISISMFQVDVFELPRFCDDISYLMNRRLLAAASPYYILKCLQLIFHTFLRFLWISTLMGLLLMIISMSMFQVDVFELPRFCDDFSYLMSRRFLAPASPY